MEHATSRIPKPQRIVEHRCMDCGSNVCFKDGSGVRRCERCGSANVRLVDANTVKDDQRYVEAIANQILKITKDSIMHCVNVNSTDMTAQKAIMSIDDKQIISIVRAAKETVKQLQTIYDVNSENGMSCPNCGAPLTIETETLYAGTAWREYTKTKCEYCVRSTIECHNG